MYAVAHLPWVVVYESHWGEPKPRTSQDLRAQIGPCIASTYNQHSFRDSGYIFNGAKFFPHYPHRKSDPAQ